jgi:hypothetical protein
VRVEGKQLVATSLRQSEKPLCDLGVKLSKGCREPALHPIKSFFFFTKTINFAIHKSSNNTDIGQSELIAREMLI